MASNLSTIPMPSSEIHVLQVPRHEVLQAVPPPDQIEKVLSHCEGEMDSFQLMGGLLSGSTTLWVHQSGWTVTAIWGQWIDIICMYDEEWGNAEHVLNHFLGLARSWGLKGVRTLNLRKGAARRAEEWGFRPRLVEYVKEC